MVASLWILHLVRNSDHSLFLKHLLLTSIQNLYCRLHEQNKQLKSCPWVNGHTLSGRGCDWKLHAEVPVLLAISAML